MKNRVSYERWSRIKDYPDYLISTSGRVKSFRSISSKLNGGRMLTDTDNGRGYRSITLTNVSGNKTNSLHRLIAITFLPNPENKAEVNHIDGNKANNRVDNLEWVTSKENTNHAIDSGLIDNKKAVLQFTIDGDFVREYESIKEAGRQTGVDDSAIVKVCKGIHRQSGNYIWKYKNN